MDDYHRRLQAQGVDGVKVDNQAVIESLASGQGGRVTLTRAYREALETSVAAHFAGRLINCMSNGMETYYGSPRSTLIRTSIDFWPTRPETHGAHLYCNAQVGVWFGEFMQPDWDMFQSGHVMGPFHAAGRAVSGGPVYVSDKIDGHNFGVLRKLVLSDGTVLRADRPGRPTRDCLFVDVTREPVLLKIFNYNRDCAVIGLFNANYHAAEAARVTIAGAGSPMDAPDLAGDEFAGFAQQANRVWHCRRTDREPVQLAEGGWEIVSYAPVDRGVAVLGLADKLNSTGAITTKGWNADGTFAVTLRDGGEFTAWTERPPRALEAEGRAVAFRHDAATGRLSATLPATGPKTVLLRW
jgi:raffinose synthase